MKSFYWVLCVLATLSSTHFAWAEPKQSDLIVVTDIDDTIKITNVQSVLSMIKNGIFKKKTFLGMAELFQEVSLHADFYYLSLSPKLLEGHLTKTLEEHSFPEGKILLPHLLKIHHRSSFKLENLEMLAQTTQLPMLLFGDDIADDPEIFSRFRAARPERVLEIYIHKIKDRELPEGIFAFSNPLDVATNEMLQNRMEIAQVEKIGEKIAHGNLHDLFPDYKKCLSSRFSPVDFDEHPHLSLIFKMMDDVIRKFCKTIHRAEAVIRTRM